MTFTHSVLLPPQIFRTKQEQKHEPSQFRNHLHQSSIQKSIQHHIAAGRINLPNNQSQMVSLRHECKFSQF